MDGVIVGGWGWVVAAYSSAAAVLAFYVGSLFVRRRRIEGAVDLVPPVQGGHAPSQDRNVTA